MKEYEYRDENGNPIDYYTIVNDATQMLKEIEEKGKEIKRLNNIIDELENWLNIEIDRTEKMINPKVGIRPYGEELTYLRTIKNSYIYAKNKLKELKGGDE